MDPSALTLQELHSRLWDLQRLDRAEEATALLLSSLPLAEPAAAASTERWLWRQLVELGFDWALERRGPAACEALVQRQLAGGGLPSSLQELKAAAVFWEREGQPRTALVHLYQVLALHRQGQAPITASQEQDPRLALARLLAAEGWIEAADAALTPLLAEPQPPVEALQLGALLAYRRQAPAESAHRWHLCLAADPHHPLAPLFLARLALEAGEADAAASHLAQLVSRPAGSPQPEAQLRALLWQHGLQTSDPNLQVLAPLPQLLADPYLNDPAGLLRWAPAQLAGADDTKALHQAVAALQQRLGAALPAFPRAWWDQEEPKDGEAPIRLAVLAASEQRLNLPFGPGDALVAALAAHGIETHWLHPAELGSTRAGVERLRAERFDAVLDLIGWGPGHRQDLLRVRVAPLQVLWPGDGVGCAAPWLDALLLDRFTAPEPALLPDALLVSPGSMICRADLPPDPPPGRAAAEPLTLGVLAQPGRLGRHCLAVWAELLAELPTARLLFIGSAYGQACVQRHLGAALTSLGVAVDRFAFLALDPRQESPEALVPLLAEQLDIGLDPLPAGDPLASLQCLWAGVPVVCGTGEALHQRLSAGLLEQVGMEAFVAGDGEQYQAIALTLAEDAELRAELRGQLRPQLAGSLVTNLPQFAQDLAQALRTAQRQRCARRGSLGMPAPWDQALEATELEALIRDSQGLPR